MSLAVVGRIVSREPHPNADRLDVIWVDYGQKPAQTRLVVGKHYQVGDLGVILKPGGLIPGWLAHSLWLVGKKKAAQVDFKFTVKEIPIRGVVSQGLWYGQYYQVDSSNESQEHYKELKEHGGIEIVRDGVSWIKPPHWKDEWVVGQEVDSDFEVVKGET